MDLIVNPEVKESLLRSRIIKKSDYLMSRDSGGRDYDAPLRGVNHFALHNALNMDLYLRIAWLYLKRLIERPEGL